jgi:acyl dehydratase
MEMRHGPYFEDVEVGDELPVLKKSPITRLQLSKYAAASGDFNPSHVDEDIAREAGMKGVFAHCMLGMGFLSQLLTDWLFDRPLRMFSTRAVILVRPGDSLECHGKIVRKWVEEDDNLIEIALEACNQRGEPTHTGRAIALLPARPVKVRTDLKSPYLMQHKVIG